MRALGLGLVITCMFAIWAGSVTAQTNTPLAAPLSEQSLPAIPESDLPVSEKLKQKERLLDMLIGHKGWLEWWNRRYQYTWYASTFLVILLTGLTSVLAALGLAERPKGKAAIIILPALASLLSTGLVQFQIRENWQLRELGRVEFERFILDALILDANDASFHQKLVKIYSDALAVQREQTLRFFAGFSQADDRRRSPEAVR